MGKLDILSGKSPYQFTVKRTQQSSKTVNLVVLELSEKFKVIIEACPFAST